MLTEGDFYPIVLIASLIILFIVLMYSIILKTVKYILKSYKKNAQRRARKKIRTLRNMEVVKNIKSKNISAIF